MHLPLLKSWTQVIFTNLVPLSVNANCLHNEQSRSFAINMVKDIVNIRSKRSVFTSVWHSLNTEPNEDWDCAHAPNHLIRRPFSMVCHSYFAWPRIIARAWISFAHFSTFGNTFDRNSTSTTRPIRITAWSRCEHDRLRQVPIPHLSFEHATAFIRICTAAMNHIQLSRPTCPVPGTFPRIHCQSQSRRADSSSSSQVAERSRRNQQFASAPATEWRICRKVRVNDRPNKYLTVLCLLRSFWNHCRLLLPTQPNNQVRKLWLNSAQG